VLPVLLQKHTVQEELQLLLVIMSIRNLLNRCYTDAAW